MTKNYAVIENGIVINTIVAKDIVDIKKNKSHAYVEYVDDVSIGDTYDGNFFASSRNFTAPALSFDRKRQKEYEQIDGEGMEAMRKAIIHLYDKTPTAVKPDEFVTYLGKIEAIKEAVPKP